MSALPTPSFRDFPEFADSFQPLCVFWNHQTRDSGATARKCGDRKPNLGGSSPGGEPGPRQIQSQHNLTMWQEWVGREKPLPVAQPYLLKQGTVLLFFLVAVNGVLGNNVTTPHWVLVLQEYSKLFFFSYGKVILKLVIFVAQTCPWRHSQSLWYVHPNFYSLGFGNLLNSLWLIQQGCQLHVAFMLLTWELLKGISYVKQITVVWSHSLMALFSFNFILVG